MEIEPLDDRIRDICERAVTAKDSEVPKLLAELKALMQSHSEFLRYMVARTINRTFDQESISPSKAAD